MGPSAVTYVPELLRTSRLAAPLPIAPPGVAHGNFGEPMKVKVRSSVEPRDASFDDIQSHVSLLSQIQQRLR